MVRADSQPKAPRIAGRDTILDSEHASEGPEDRRALDALREGEARYHALLDGLDAIVWQVDLPATTSLHDHSPVLPFSFVSQQAEAILGYPVERWLTEPDFWINHIHPDDRERMLAHCRDAVDAPREHEMEYRMLAADGRVVWVRDRVRLVRDGGGRPQQLCGVIQDITAHKQAEETLRASEERFRALVENAADGIVLLARDGTILYASPINRRVFGWNPGKVLGSTWMARVHPDDLEACQAQFLNAIEHPAEPVAAEARVRATDGSWRWVEGTARNLLGHPSVRAIVVNSRDITERKQAEETLRASEERFRALVQSVDAIVWEADAATFQFSFVSERAEKVLGYPTEQWLSEPDFWVQHLHPDDRERAVALCRTATAEGRDHDFEYRAIAPDGRVVWLRDIVRVVGNGLHGAGLLHGLMVDITERKQAEEELNRSREQLRALSAELQRVREEERTRVAREIHDELGQTLSALKMDLAWLRKRLGRVRLPVKTREKADSMSHLIDTTIQAVRKICSDLRPAVLDDFGLAAAIEWQAQDFLTRTGIRCEFTSSLDAAAQAALMNRDVSTALFRILQESLTNVARHAHATTVRIALCRRADELVLEVADDGRGMTEAERLDPNSLGLLGMRERARQLGGQLTIVGAPARGTTVIVCVPLAQTKGR